MEFNAKIEQIKAECFKRGIELQYFGGGDGRWQFTYPNGNKRSETRGNMRDDSIEFITAAYVNSLI